MENQFEKLPLEIIWYIEDTVESNRKFHWYKKKKDVGEFLNNNFIRELVYSEEGCDDYQIKCLNFILKRNEKISIFMTSVGNCDFETEVGIESDRCYIHDCR